MKYKKINKKKVTILTIVLIIILLLIVLGIFLNRRNSVYKLQENIEQEQIPDGLKITYERKYQDGDGTKLPIVITITGDEGIAKIITPDEEEITPVNFRTKLAIDYTIETNKEYEITAIGNNGETVTEPIFVPPYTILNRALIREDGIFNMILDGEYVLEPTVHPLSNDALGIKAYDGDESTYIQGGTGYIDIDPSAWNKEIHILSKSLWATSFGDSYGYTYFVDSNGVLSNFAGGGLIDENVTIPSNTSALYVQSFVAHGIFEIKVLESLNMNIEIEVTDVTTNSFRLNITNDYPTEDNIQYKYYITKVSDSSNIYVSSSLETDATKEISGLIEETEYKIKVEAYVDGDMNRIKSTEKLITTKMENYTEFKIVSSYIQGNLNGLFDGNKDQTYGACPLWAGYNYLIFGVPDGGCYITFSSGSTYADSRRMVWKKCNI